MNEGYLVLSSSPFKLTVESCPKVSASALFKIELMGRVNAVRIFSDADVAVVRLIEKEEDNDAEQDGKVLKNFSEPEPSINFLVVRTWTEFAANISV